MAGSDDLIRVAYSAVTDQGEMIRIVDAGDPEVPDLDFGARQDEIQLFFGARARIRWRAGQVCGPKAGCGHEQLDFIVAPTRIEIAGDDDRFVPHPHEIVEIGELIMAMAVLEREMHQKNVHLVKLELDQEAFHSGIEIVKLNLPLTIPGDECIGLFAHDRQVLHE